MATAQDLEAWLAPLLASLEPAAVRRLARQLAIGLRQRQAARIAAQRNPDGSAYAPRSARSARRLRAAAAAPGAQRRARTAVQGMFAKLRTARHLKVRSSAAEAVVEIPGRSGRIAAVHQFGLVDRPQPGGPEVRYPERVLLGLSDDDSAWIEGELLRYLAAG